MITQELHDSASYRMTNLPNDRIDHSESARESIRLRRLFNAHLPGTPGKQTVV